MKYFLLFATLITAILAGNCKKMQKPNTAVAPVEERDPASYGYPWKASHVIDGSNPDSAFTYQIKKAPARVLVPWDKVAAPSTSRRAFLSTGYWMVRMAYQPSDTTVHTNYLGKFLQFRQDQTFDIIQDGKVLESGNWAYDDDKKLIYISCRNTYFNNSWKVQENGFRIVLLGNTDLNVTGIQMRLDGVKTMPAPEK